MYDAVVIQNVSDYRKKVQELFNKDGKFIKLLINPTSTRIDKLQKLLRPFREDVGDQLYFSLYPSGATAGILYGLPKIHKDRHNASFRPIISAVDTYNYKEAKHLETILILYSKILRE